MFVGQMDPNAGGYAQLFFFPVVCPDHLRDTLEKSPLT